MARVSMGYPDPRSEMDMLAEHAAANPLDTITPVADAALVSRLVDVVRTIHVAESVRQYAVDISNATREHGDVRLGASPRATLHLVRAARRPLRSTTATTCCRTTCRLPPRARAPPHLTADAQIAGAPRRS
jgi:MoxR-like ATPase